MGVSQVWFGVLTAAIVTGCGSALPSLLDNAQGQTPKVACPGDHQGFYVCLSDTSSLSDQTLAQTIATGLGQLATLVNSANFQTQVGEAFTEGQSIDATLSGANYIVTITGYCDSTSSTLAQAIVGGDTIQYNECTVQRDASGQPLLAEVSGVLLHEISHNLGYTHPAVNPSRSTVPYYLGDLATSDLRSGGGRSRYTWGD